MKQDTVLDVTKFGVLNAKHAINIVKFIYFYSTINLGFKIKLYNILTYKKKIECLYCSGMNSSKSFSIKLI